MQGYELFKGYGFSFGHDYIIHGVNYARLGYTKSQMLNRYSVRHGEDHFKDLLLGYDNAFNDGFIKSLESVTIPRIDTLFIFNNILNNKLMRDFEFDCVVKEYDLDINKTLVTCTHKKYDIEITIEFTRSVYTDSTWGCHWGVESTVSGLSAKYGNMYKSSYVIDDFKCSESQYSQPISSGKVTEASYRCSFQNVNKRLDYFTVAPSSIIVKAIRQMVANFVRRYNLDNETVVEESVTIGVLLKEKFAEKENSLKQYVIFWLDGKKTDIEGKDEKDAFTKSGYGNGAVRAVDFIGYKETENNYSWDKEKRSWVNNTFAKIK
jgi:hypothetical protein